MGHYYGGYGYIEQHRFPVEPLLRPGDVDLGRTFNKMRRKQRIEQARKDAYYQTMLNAMAPMK